MDGRSMWTEVKELRSGLVVRIARPTTRLKEVVAFYRDAVGLSVLAQFEDHAGYSGVILGIAGEKWHLEFTQREFGSACPPPSQDNLLVLYVADQQSYDAALSRIELHGHVSVEPENPYWKDLGRTFEDPDGWRIVLYRGGPFSSNPL